MDQDTLNIPAEAVTEPSPATPPQVAAPAAPAPVKGKFLLTAPDGTVYRLDKYPMPRKAAVFPMKVNGTVVDAAQTTFGEIKYTYFSFNGIGFQIPAHVPGGDLEYTFTYPADYVFVEKSNARIQMNERAKVRAAEAKAKAAAAPKPEPGAAPEGSGVQPETTATAPGEGSVGVGTSGDSDASTDPQQQTDQAPGFPGGTPAPTKGKKAQR